MTDAKWRAEMPPRHLGKVMSGDLCCHEGDVEALKDRANAELDAAEAREIELRASRDAYEKRIAELSTEISAFESKVGTLRAQVAQQAEWLEQRHKNAEYLSARLCEESKAAETREAAKDARIAELEAQIRELTEWRPMETAPRDGRSILARILGGNDVIGWTGVAWTDGHDTYNDAHYLGWLPIQNRRKGIPHD